MLLFQQATMTEGSRIKETARMQCTDAPRGSMLVMDLGVLSNVIMALEGTLRIRSSGYMVTR
jgi:hypothetical protein